MKKKMIIKVIVDLENQAVGVSEVKVSTNTNVGQLLGMGGAEFLSLIFKQLSESYKEKARKGGE